MKTCWHLKQTILISGRFLQLRAVDSSFVHSTHSVCFWADDFRASVLKGSYLKSLDNENTITF